MTTQGITSAMLREASRKWREKPQPPRMRQARGFGVPVAPPEREPPFRGVISEPDLPFEQYQRVNKALVETVNVPLFSVGGVNISAPDIVAVGLIAYMGVKGVQALIGVGKEVVDKSVQFAMNKGVDEFIRKLGRGAPPSGKLGGVYSRLPQDLQIKIAQYLQRNPGLVERATNNYQQRIGRGIPGGRAAQETSTEMMRDIVRNEQSLAKFTPGGTAVPGQTRSLADIMAGARAELRPEGVPMPPEARTEAIVRANALLETNPIPPNTLKSISTPVGEVLVRTDAEGQTLVVAQILPREGQMTASNIVLAEGKGLAGGRAVKEVVDYLQKNNIALPPREEMSPEALRLVDKTAGVTPEAPPEPLRAIPEGKKLTKAQRELEEARQEAQGDIALAERPSDLTAVIRDIETELGNRSIPFHGRAKALFPGTTTQQLDEMLKVYNEALRTKFPAEGVTPPVTPRPTEVPSAEAPEAPPVKPPKITNPEWSEFWIETQNLGLTNKEVHQYLGVESVKEWVAKGETLQKAIEELTPKSETKNIALNKALISETGKTTDQYRRLVQNITGKKDVKDMTPDEVVRFTEALERYPEKKWSPKTGQWIPQSIPKTTAIVPENYFNLEFKEPTPIRLLTSQNYYATKLGVSPLTQPLEIAKQELDLVYPAWARATEGKIKALDKAYKVTAAEKFIAFRNNKPTRASAEMAMLLNKYENLPADMVDKLGAEKVKLFSWFRNLSRTMLNAQNEVRELLNMPLIPNRQAYYRHMAIETAKEVWQGNYSLPSDLAYWSSRVVGKRVFNPMEIPRKIPDDLLEYFSKDLGYVTKSMLWTGLKEIYLSQPLKSFTAQLSVLSKGMMPFSSLSPEELVKAEAFQPLPKSTKEWVVNYVNAVIKGQQTELDASINRMITQSGIGKLFDTVLKEFGRSIGTKPVTKMAEFSGRLIINATIGTKPRQIIRNLHQSVQNMALYGITPTLRAFLPAGRTLSRMLDQSLFLKTYARVEELPPSAMGKVEKAWMWAYGRSAIFNARTGMKAAYYGTSPLITNKGNAKYGWGSPERTYKEERGFLYPEEERNLMREMEFGAGATQYQYIGMGMPEIFRHKTLIPFTRLQSWWMNYFAKFNREAMGRFWNGHVGWDKNLKLPPSMRLNWMKYLILGGAILTAMGYKRSFMRDVLPHWASPASQFAVSAYSYVTADTDYERENAKKTMFYSFQAFIPGLIDYTMWKQYFDGERPLSSIFFYTEEFPPDMPTWGIPFLEEEVVVKNRIKEANTEIPKFQEKLGQTIPAEDGVEEYVYDMSDLGSDIRAILRNIPPERITSAEGFPDIAVMYNQSLPMIDGYYRIPASQRQAFIKQKTPESVWTGAYLVIWGKLKVTGWVSSNSQTLALIEKLKKDYGIPSSVIPKPKATPKVEPTPRPEPPSPFRRTSKQGGGITDRMLQEALE